MSMIILVTAFILAFGSLIYSWVISATLVKLESKKRTQKPVIRDGFYSLTSGLMVALVGLIAGLIFLPLVYCSVLGVLFALSGFRVLYKSLKSKEAQMNLNQLIISIGVFGIALLFISLELIFPTRAIATHKQIPEITQAQTKTGFRKQRKVYRNGVVRNGPSKRSRILGNCVKGSDVQVIRRESGWYYVKGIYKPKHAGEGEAIRGTFWIGGSLLD